MASNLDEEQRAGEEERYEKKEQATDQTRQDEMADDEEVMKKVEVKPDEFNGLIGNIAGNLIRDKVGAGTECKRAGD